jgi:site-specific DNA-methyltransferase (adenine-specific)
MSVELYHGDCLEFMRTLQPGRVNVAITDPPYLFGAASISGTNNHKVSRWGDLLNQSYFFKEIITSCRRVLSRDGAMWMFTSWRSLPVMMKAAVESDASIDSILVWDKCWIGPGGPVGLRPSYELVVLIPFGNFALPNRGLADIQRFQWSSTKPNGHPAEKPLSLLSWLVTNSTREGDTVADWFMGSGTTGVACIENNRDFIGAEIDDYWYTYAQRRIAQAEAQPRLLPLDAPTPTQEELML